MNHTFTHAEYPWTGKRLSVGGFTQHVLDVGRGPPVVMLHGNPTWSFYYRHLVHGLSADFRCIVPDHIGCGLSDKPPASAYPYTLARRIDDLESVLDQLQVNEPFTLVVHDWGGAVGLGYAVRHPERVARMVLFNTSGFGLPPGRKLPWEIGVCRDLPVSPFLVRGLNAFVLGAALRCSAKGRLVGETRRGYLFPYRSWADRVAIAEFVKDIPLEPAHRSWDALQQIERGLPSLAGKPTLIAWGGQDFVFDHAFLAEWKKRLPFATVWELPDAGHYVLEDAHEVIVPRVRAFLGARAEAA